LSFKVCQDAQWLGVRLHEEANRKGGPKISAEDSDVAVWVIPTDEDMMIACHTYDFINSAGTNNANGQPK
jgi:acetate kinase